MTEPFDIRTLPAGTIIKADGAWRTFQAHRHHISHDPIIRDGTTPLAMTKLPTPYLVVIDLLEGSTGFDGLTVAPFAWTDKGPQRGCEQFALRQRTPANDDHNDGFVEVDRSMVVGVLHLNVGGLPVLAADKLVSA